MPDQESSGNGNGGNTQTVNPNAPRTITIITTRGEKTKIENFTGTKWKELQKKVEGEGFDLSSMKAVEGVNKHTLEHEDAVLPQGNFNLFLMPYKSKAGSKRTDLYDQIAKFKKKDPEKAGEHFGNHTQKSTEDLANLVNKYDPEAYGKAKDRKAAKGSAIADVVGAVKESKKDKKDILYSEVNKLNIEDRMFLMIQLLVDIKDIVTGGKAETGTEVSTKPAKTQEEIDAEDKEKEEEEKKKKEKEEQDRKEKEENDALNEEMSSMVGGLKDVEKTRTKIGSRR